MNFWQKLPRPILALAPMAGYTDSAFRQICRRLGADVVYSEMISVDALCRHNQKTLAMLKHVNKEYPLIIQLFGTDPQKFIKAITVIEDNFNKKYSDSRLLTHNSVAQIGLDINLGCPAKKITRNGAGAALMNNLNLAYKIIKTVTEHSPWPVSLKIRTKVKDTTALEFLKKIKKLPWTTVMVHGRSLAQGFEGEIDSGVIKQIKLFLPEKIVLANGGITDSPKAQKILAQTTADGLGIARGALGNPWLFQSIKKNKPADITPTVRKKLIIAHAKLFLRDNPDLIQLRKHLVHYLKGQKNASLLRQKLITVTNIKELENILS